MSGVPSKHKSGYHKRREKEEKLQFAHSLNLVGHSAVDNISASSKFFELVENVYSFFSASTHRWELLVNALGGHPVVKCLSDTRWAAHSDASKALNCDGFRAIYGKPG